MYERLSDERVAHALCEYDTRNPACKGSKRAPCGNCVACVSGMAYMAHELLERREAEDRDAIEATEQWEEQALMR